MKAFVFFFILLLASAICEAQESRDILQYHPVEWVFEGPVYEATDNPVRDVHLSATWRHEKGFPTFRIPGFYDGDGKGGKEGNVFKVRFTPTQPGTWELVEVESNVPELAGQHEGAKVNCLSSDHPGFWMPDPSSPGQRWYQRSRGEHPFIVGNTMYTFLSEYGKTGPNGSDIQQDITDNAKYFNKLRFALTGDLYPHPTEKPFLNHEGHPTDDGNFSHRPNPTWFTERVDLAVASAFEADLIADLILNGPDSPYGRSNLLAAENGNDPGPFLRYVAARYGSYPNVWICLSNEYNIRQPQFSEEDINRLGHKMKALLPYPTPLSVHANQQDWDPTLNTLIPWNDHVIIQNKLKLSWMAADITELNFWKGGAQHPVINDELAYEGAGDDWSEEDVLVAFLGTFLGGGYGSTGHKPGPKLGGYFAGNFDLEGHASSDNLQWFRQMIDRYISFWEMAPYTIFYYRPGSIDISIFRNTNYSSRVLANPGKEYVLGGAGPQQDISVRLPEGTWEITRYDLLKMERITLSDGASDTFRFDLPESPAVWVHVRKKD